MLPDSSFISNPLRLNGSQLLLTRSSSPAGEPLPRCGDAQSPAAVREQPELSADAVPFPRAGRGVGAALHRPRCRQAQDGATCGEGGTQGHGALWALTRWGGGAIRDGVEVIQLVSKKRLLRLIPSTSQCVCNGFVSVTNEPITSVHLHRRLCGPERERDGEQRPTPGGGEELHHIHL